MTIGPGQYIYPRDTMEALLKDYEKRILRVERRGSLTNVENRAVTVATITDLEDPDVAVYALDTELVYYQGNTYTWAAWQAIVG